MVSDNQSGDTNVTADPQPSTPMESFKSSRRRQGGQSSGGSGGGLGCALAGIIVLIVIVLIGVALFLPPFSVGERLFGTPYAALSAQSPSASQGGLTVSLSSADAGSGFGGRIKTIASGGLMGQAAPKAEEPTSIRAAHSALPTTLTLVSPLYRIEKQGTTKAPVTLSINVPQGADVSQL